ncbi:hypothetical protein BH11ARM1_BH11ARM1_07010 [soil metagenome]
MNIPVGLEAALSIDQEVMHGELCFKGTRVPVKVLLDNIQEGSGLDQFLSDYPSVSRKDAEAVLAWEADKLMTAANLSNAA